LRIYIFFFKWDFLESNDESMEESEDIEKEKANTPIAINAMHINLLAIKI
jgi:hypothetical protein